MSELEKLVSKTVTVRVGTEDVDVTPMRVGAWAAFLVAAKPFLSGLTVSVTDKEKEKDLGIEMLLEHPEALVKAVAVATKMSEKKVEALFPDEFAGLLQAVITVNADFFTTRVLPAFTRLVDTVSAAIPGAPAAPTGG